MKAECSSENEVQNSEKTEQLEKEKRLRLIVFRTIVQLTDTVSTDFLLQKVLFSIIFYTRRYLCTFLFINFGTLTKIVS